MNITAVDYPILRNRPVARFRYKGSHSKAIRREVFITDLRKDVVTGYEVREGNNTCDLGDAPIKSFARDKIMGFERLSLKSAGVSTDD
jgi:hypothetical protein